MSRTKKIVHRGLSHYRTKREPLEREFARAWAAENATSDTLRFLLVPTERLDDPVWSRRQPTQEEATAVATAIQWLGSPVGQSFLREVLTTKAGLRFLGVDRLGIPQDRVIAHLAHTAMLDSFEASVANSNKPTKKVK